MLLYLNFFVEVRGSCADVDGGVEDRRSSEVELDEGCDVSSVLMCSDVYWCCQVV